MTFVDPETGRQLQVNTRDKNLRARFAARAAAEREELAGALRVCTARHVVLSTSGDWLRRLATYLRRPPPPLTNAPSARTTPAPGVATAPAVQGGRR
jgi:bifunctional pyridoxal-dependent enzyme with beta-cystathionase and maltose regulon repressor activities